MRWRYAVALCGVPIFLLCAFFGRRRGDFAWLDMFDGGVFDGRFVVIFGSDGVVQRLNATGDGENLADQRSEEHTSELQSH